MSVVSLIFNQVLHLYLRNLLVKQVYSGVSVTQVTCESYSRDSSNRFETEFVSSLSLIILSSFHRIIETKSPNSNFKKCIKNLVKLLNQFIFLTKLRPSFGEASRALKLANSVFISWLKIVESGT